ncbi:MAG: TerC family protein [Alphaproteobacteria bacterium]
MLESLTGSLSGPVLAFFQVVMIDVALAGDNAVAVGLAASGLPEKDRRKAIVLGLGGAMIMLICFALVAVQLLNVIGLLLAGGILLLWVCWKMWRDLRDPHHVAEAEGEAALEDATTGIHKVIKHKGKPKTLGGALATILLADLSMSLDNVLAVAGAAREHPFVLVFGLILSVTMMGIAATWIARLLMKWRWLGYLGLAIIFYVALHMIWEGHRQVVVKSGELDTYNRTVPGFLTISPEEVAKFQGHAAH